MDVFELIARLRLDSSDYDDGLDRAGNKASGFASKLRGGMATAAKVGGAAIAAATTAVAAFGVSSVKTGMQFDSAMAQVAATMGVTIDEIQNLRDFALEMGSKTAFSATESAEALNYMALAGYDAETAMGMLPNVLNLAAAGSIDLAYASDMITDSQSALGLSLAETTELVDKMAMASSKSNTSVSQLGEAILTVGGTAKNLAGGTTELATALGIIADNGVKGAEGGTALRNIILSLSSPTDQAAKLMQQLGLSVFDAEGNMRGLNDIFTDLNGILGSMSQEERMNVLSDLFNKVDLKSVNALLANSGDRFNELSGYIDEAAGAAERMSMTQLDNLAGDVQLFTSALEGAKIAVSDVLTPSLREFVQFGTDGLARLTDAFRNGGLSEALDVFGEIVSDGVEMLMKNLPKMVEAGAQLLVALGRGIVQNLPLIAQTGLNIILMLAQGIISAIPNIIASLPQIIVGIVNFITSNLPAIVQTGVQIIIGIIQGLAQALPQLIAAAPQIIMAIVQGIWQSLQMLWASGPQIIQALADGLRNAFGALIQLGADLVRAIAEGILSALGWLGDAIISVFNGGLSAGDQAASQYRAMGEHAATETTDGYRSGSSGFSSAVSESINEGKSAADAGASGFSGSGGSAASNWLSGWSGGSGSFDSGVSGSMSGAVKTANGWAPQFAAPGESAISNLTNPFLSGGGQIAGGVDSAMGSALSAGEAGAVQFGQVGTSMISQTTSSIAAAAPAVSSAARGVVVTAFTVANAATSMFTSVGAQMAAGIARGVMSAAGQVAAAAANVVRSALAAAKAAAAIASPSKKFRDEVGVYMGLGVAEGIEDSEDKAVQAAKQLAEKTYQTSAEWLRRQTKFQRLTLEEQLEVWQEIQSQYIKTSKQWIQAEEQIFDLREKMADEQARAETEAFNDAKENIRKQTKFQRLSIAEQIAMWTDLLGKYEVNSKEYMEIDEEIFDLREKLADDYADKVKDTWKNIANAYEDYTDKLADRTKQIASAYGLFDDVQDRTRMSGQELITNLTRQVNVMSSFYEELDQLAERGASSALVDEIRQMGPKAVDQLDALLAMTDKQFDQYVTLYGKKQDLANDTAIKELEGLKAETIDEIKDQLKALDDLYEQTSPALGKTFTQSLAQGIKDSMGSVVQAATKLANEANNAFLSSLNSQISSGFGSGSTKIIPFSQSALGSSSAQIINTVNNKTSAGGVIDVKLNVDSATIARVSFDALKNYAASKGKPIVAAT